MPRRKCCRRVSDEPACALFKPAGVPARQLEKVPLGVDEFEALRLADYEGLYHQQAATRMNVSRQTFGRIISAARSSVATALIEGKALKIEGGVFKLDDGSSADAAEKAKMQAAEGVRLKKAKEEGMERF